MNHPDPVEMWVRDLQIGSEEQKEEARRQIFARYYDSLVRIALSQMSARLRRRSDESRAASAMRTVLEAIEGGRTTPGSDDELHRLLAFNTIQKVRHAARHHTALKRDYRREMTTDDILAEIAHQAPDAAWLVEELEFLDDKLKEVATLWLDGADSAEIAEMIGRSRVTVDARKRQIIEKLKDRLASPE